MLRLFKTSNIFVNSRYGRKWLRTVNQTVNSSVVLVGEDGESSRRRISRAREILRLCNFLFFKWEEDGITKTKEWLWKPKYCSLCFSRERERWKKFLSERVLFEDEGGSFLRIVSSDSIKYEWLVKKIVWVSCQI